MERIKNKEKKKTIKNDFNPSEQLIIPIFDGNDASETILQEVKKKEKIIEEDESETLDIYANERDFQSNKEDEEKMQKYLETKEYLTEIRQFLEPPEILVIGQDRSDKDHFIECLVGLPFFGKNINSHRIFEITLINDQSKSNIECYIDQKKKPLSLAQMLEHIDKEIDLNNGLNLPPIRLTFKHKSYFDLKIINSPSIKPGLNSLSTFKCVEKLMLQNVDRQFVVVQNCSFSEDDPITSHLIYPFDPQFSRTFFVNSDFYSFANSEQIKHQMDFEEYLQSVEARELGESFWVSLPNFHTLRKCREAEDPQAELQQRTLQVEARDHQRMNALQVERNFQENSYGLHHFKQHLKGHVLSKLQSSLPLVRNTLKQRVTSLNDKIVHLEKILLRSVDFTEARKNVSFLTCSFSDKVSLLASSSVGLSPVVHGSTSADEFEANSLWREFFGKCQFTEKHSPFLKSKILGSQQFERLFFELTLCFEKIVCFTERPEDVNSILSGEAYHNSELSTMNNKLQGICSHVDRNLRNLLLPLLNAAVDRAAHILSSFLHLAVAIRDETFANLWKSLPYVTQRIQDSYIEFVGLCSEKLRKHLSGQFFSGQAIYWQVTHFNPPNEKELSENPQRQANILFDSHKNRILKNVILAFYNFLLLPLTNDTLHSHFSSLNSVPEKQLEELCQQKISKERAEIDIKELKSNIESITKNLTGLEQLMWEF